jgi:beta-carotene hydroxylase
MNTPLEATASTNRPPLRELGLDLLRITPWQRRISLLLPFVYCGAYFAFAFAGWWPAAILALAALNFVTYGSTSHDLVHRNLGLSRRTNDWLLCLIELLALRSGHAYQAAHLHHHARFPQPDDIEAAASRMSLVRAFAEGIIFPYRIWWWAVRRDKQKRQWLYGEAAACLGLVVLAVLLIPVTSVLAVYLGLIIAGAWLNPLLTAYLPHNPHGETELTQTYLVRGKVASVLAWDHLYHLEHHLYPAVPHHNWPTLAKRLGPHFAAAGIQPVTFWM